MNLTAKHLSQLLFSPAQLPLLTAQDFQRIPEPAVRYIRKWIPSPDQAFRVQTANRLETLLRSLLN